MSTEVTGYDPDVRFYATRYNQGARTVFSLDLSLAQIAGLLPKPDPANPTEGNRRIKESHARAFGDYVRQEREWVAPALVLRAPDIFEFDVRESIGGTEFGVISFPRLAAQISGSSTASTASSGSTWRSKASRTISKRCGAHSPRHVATRRCRCHRAVREPGEDIERPARPVRP